MKPPVFVRLCSQPVAVSAGKHERLSQLLPAVAVGCIAKELSMKVQAR